MAKSERRKQNDKSDFHTFQTHLIPTVQTHLILVLLTFIPQSFLYLYLMGSRKYYRGPLNPHILPSTIFLAKYPNELEYKSGDNNNHK